MRKFEIITIERAERELALASNDGHGIEPNQLDDVCARADVEVHRHAEVGARLPQRVPVALAEVGEPVVVRIGVGVDAAQAERVHPLDSSATAASMSHHGRSAIGYMRPPRLLLDLGHRVVVDRARTVSCSVGVDHVDEALAAEADDVRVDDLRVDPLLVHHREARLHLRRAGVDVVDARAS